MITYSNTARVMMNRLNISEKEVQAVLESPTVRVNHSNMLETIMVCDESNWMVSLDNDGSVFTIIERF